MANSVTARFNDDCKVLVAMSDDTTVSKAVIIDAEGNETDIGGGGSSDLNNPINLELIDGTGNYADLLITKLTAGEIYNLCQTGTPYFTVSSEQNETYHQTYKPNTKYFINEYSFLDDEEIQSCGFKFVMLGISDVTDITVQTELDYSDPTGTTNHLIIGGGL